MSKKNQEVEVVIKEVIQTRHDTGVVLEGSEQVDFDFPYRRCVGSALLKPGQRFILYENIVFEEE